MQKICKTSVDRSESGSRLDRGFSSLEVIINTVDTESS